MKRSKFSEAQIAVILRQAEERGAGRGGVSQGRHLGRDVLQLEEALWRFDAI